MIETVRIFYFQEKITMICFTLILHLVEEKKNRGELIRETIFSRLFLNLKYLRDENQRQINQMVRE